MLSKTRRCQAGTGEIPGLGVIDVQQKGERSNDLREGDRRGRKKKDGNWHEER